MPTPFKIEGLTQLQNKLKNLPKKLEDEINEELKASSLTIEAGQKSAAPKDVGFLVNGISSQKTGKLEYENVSAATYSAWQEFGTRDNRRIPPGLEDFAAQYMGQKNASALGAKEAIYAWCRRKGIEVIYWYPIFIKIMVKGSKPHPFFFGPYLAEKPKLIARIKKIVTDIK